MFCVIPLTREGAGKTFTAVNWLFKNAVDKNKKVLWIAHRHLLLEQACESFQTSAYSDALINRGSFKFRVISGTHDHLINLENDEDILIASKDSLTRNLHLLDDWVEEGMYFIIDEAHHATAKTYRKIKDYLEEKLGNLKTIGLTATPFKTDDKESALLGKVFIDDIVYKVDLKTLINKSLLSRPIFEECDTDVLVGDNIGLNALKSIERFDNIPKNIAEEIAGNAERNAIIVNRYFNEREKYGKTIVFALNRLHAIALKKLFSLKGIKSEFIISGTSTEFTGIDISDKLNEENIEKYRIGEKAGGIDLIINVNILTEGVDLPDTNTIFLTRPTISKTLMTQMIGRGLRGEKSGGTKEAYIVSFIDDWNDNIAWVNPETVILEGPGFEPDKIEDIKSRNIRSISIKKIEEFAKLLDESIDTSHLEELEYIERIPVGMYNFTYIENEVDINCQILIYNSTKPYYDRLIEEIEDVFEYMNIKEEYIEDEKLEKAINYIEKIYFDKYIVPNYNRKDIEDLLKYYAQKGIEPNYFKLEDIDRQDLNVSNIVQNMFDRRMNPMEQGEYLKEIWDDENGLIRIYFNKFTYFINQINSEIFKRMFPKGKDDLEKPVIKKSERDKKYWPLSKWREYIPKEEEKMRNLIFNI